MGDSNQESAFPSDTSLLHTFPSLSEAFSFSHCVNTFLTCNRHFELTAFPKASSSHPNHKHIYTRETCTIPHTQIKYRHMCTQNIRGSAARIYMHSRSYRLQVKQPASPWCSFLRLLFPWPWTLTPNLN